MIELTEIEQLIELMKTTGIMELAVEKEGFKVFLRRSDPNQPEIHLNEASAESVPGNPTIEDETSIPATENTVASIRNSASPTPIVSPIVGIFHNGGMSSRKTTFREGDIVQEGQLLAIIEAMKVPNEIHAPVSGKISKLLAEDGHGVEFGQTLFLIETAQ